MTDGGSSIPEVHRLLTALVASKPAGRIAEIGTAFGAGTQALADGLGPDATLISVEPDEARHHHARAILAGSRAELVCGRWEDVLPDRAPFDLVFFDGGVSDAGLQAVIGMLATGGIVVKDDLTPGRPTDGDPVREALLRDDRLRGIELALTPALATIVAVRRA